MTVFTETWNAAFEAIPADSEDAKLGASRIRSHKKAVRERLEVDHALNGDSEDGEHKKITFLEQSSDPATVADKYYAYTKEVSGKSEIFLKDEDGNVIQLTSGGAINPAALAGNLGEIRMFGSATVPTNWLKCDGQAVSRTTYADLFGEIGTAYGIGDGSTTFNVPNFNGRSPLGDGQGDTAEGGGTGTDWSLGDEAGAEDHTLDITQIPAHNHGGEVFVTGLNVNTHTQHIGATGGPIGVQSISENTSAVNTQGGGNDHPNMSPTLVVAFCIFANA